MRRVLHISLPLLMLFPMQAISQDVAPPMGFLNKTELLHLLAFENFDDFHSLEDSDSRRNLPLDENTPTLAESYRDGVYEHYDPEGVTDRAEYSVKDHALCLKWTWSSNETYDSLNGTEDCFYIQQLGNCYLPHRKRRFARPYTEVKKTTAVFVKFGETSNCAPRIS